MQELPRPNNIPKPKDQRAAFGRLIAYLKPHKKSVAAGVLSNIGFGLVALVPPLIFRRILDQIVVGRHFSHATSLKLLIGYTVALVVLFAMSSVLLLFRASIMHILGEKIILDVRKQVYSKLQALSVSYFDNRQTGEIMSRVTNDTEVVQEFIDHAADTLISDTIRLVGMITIMMVISPKLAGIALIPVPFLFFLAFRFSRRVRPVYRSMRQRLAEINAKVQENLSGIRVIKAFAREDHEQGNFNRNAEGFYDTRIKTVRLWSMFAPSVEMVINSGEAIIWLVGPLMILSGQATVGTLLLFIWYQGMMFQPVRGLAQINDTIQRSLAAAERVFEILDEMPTIQDSPDAIEMPRINGRVEFEHVDFRYEEGDEVLRDVCIKAEPGQIVALVGRSGAGKTSIVNLIPRFYDPIDGRVLVDGFDVRYVTQDSLRRQIAMVLQDTFLFNGTIRDNIRYGKLDASDEEIVGAAKAANAHEFIEVMQSGYDTEIGERGVKLSGGQKQRMAIARAILADPRILILDEATSSVDSESEYLIHRAMDRLMEGRTTFVIAHRLSTVKHADQIICLELGRVSEIGDHKSLIESNGTYSQMYEMQFRLDEETR